MQTLTTFVLFIFTCSLHHHTLGYTSVKNADMFIWRMAFTLLWVWEFGVFFVGHLLPRPTPHFLNSLPLNISDGLCFISGLVFWFGFLRVLFYFGFFGSAKNWTEGFTVSRQVLYCGAMPSAPGWLTFFTWDYFTANKIILWSKDTGLLLRKRTDSERLLSPSPRDLQSHSPGRVRKWPLDPDRIQVHPPPR